MGATSLEVPGARDGSRLVWADQRAGRALRQVRHQCLTVGAPERAAFVLGLALVAALTFVAVAGLSDWQSCWFCPNGTSMQA